MNTAVRSEITSALTKDLAIEAPSQFLDHDAQVKTCVIIINGHALVQALESLLTVPYLVNTLKCFSS